MKVLSCGIILKNKTDFLITRSTNNSKWNIPKGILDKADKTEYNASIRELKEETDIDIFDYEIFSSKFLGHFNYLPYKDLSLFEITVKTLPELSSMKCTSMFYNDRFKIYQKEIADYKYIPLQKEVYTKYFNKSLIPIFNTIYN